MAAQKVAEERQAAESTRPEESAREVIWELEVRELPNKETVLSMKYPLIRSISIPRPGVCCLLLWLKNIMEQRGVILVCILVHLTLIGQIDKRLFSVLPSAKVSYSEGEFNHRKTKFFRADSSMQVLSPTGYVTTSNVTLILLSLKFLF